MNVYRFYTCRNLQFVVIALALTRLFGCGVNIFSTSKEVSMGSEFAKEIESTVTLLDNAEWIEYIDEIGQKIVSVCDRPDIQYHFKIVDDSTAINAFALPGGFIYVYSGLLLRADNEAEVAGVLAHEVGHVVGRHGMKRLTSMYGYQLILAIALGNNPSQLEQIAADVLGGLGMLNYGRNNEYEADSYGITYLDALRYDPHGFVTFFEKLAEAHESDPSFVETLMSTHPHPVDRINRAQETINTLTANDSVILNEDIYRQRKKTLYD